MAENDETRYLEPTQETGRAMKTYRQGWLGALMDEYERAAGELAQVVTGISDEEYGLVRDTATKDEECRTIRTVFFHVVAAGYGYAILLRIAWGLEKLDRPRDAIERTDAPAALQAMLEATSAALERKWNLPKTKEPPYRFARAGEWSTTWSNCSSTPSSTCSGTGGRSNGF